MSNRRRMQKKDLPKKEQDIIFDYTIPSSNNLYSGDVSENTNGK